MPVKADLDRQEAAQVLLHPGDHQPEEVAQAELTVPIVAHVRLRCVCDGVHWLWPGCTDRSGKPVMRWQGCLPRSVRALVWEDVHGRPVPPDRVAAAACDVPGCVSPHCVAATTRSALHRRVYASMNNAERHRNIALAMRRKKGAPEEVVAAVRAAELPAGSKKAVQELAAQHGVSVSAVYQWRRGDLRRPFDCPIGSIAAALMP